jgi:Phosphotransferase enzyme family
MADHELAQPGPRLLEAVARIAGVDRVLVMDETLRGESRSTFAVAAGDDQLVVKLVPGARRAIDNQRRLIRLVSDLRRRGYPAPEYVGVGESGGTIFTVQRRLPGQTLLGGPGMPPAPELFAAVLPSLLAAIELQRDAGDLAYLAWTTVYLCHLSLRQVEWSRRHSPPPGQGQIARAGWDVPGYAGVKVLGSGDQVSVVTSWLHPAGRPQARVKVGACAP